MKAHQQATGWTYCYNKANPTTVVMLAPAKKIIDQLISNTQQPDYFWIYPDILQAQQFITEQFSQIKEKSHVFEGFQKMMQFLQKNKFKNKIIVIYSLQFCNEVEKYLGKKQFVQFISFELQSQKKQFQESQEQITNLDQLTVWQNSVVEAPQQQKILKCNSQQELNHAFKFNLWTYQKGKSFPNFIIIKKDIVNSKLFVRTLATMLKQEIDVQTRIQIAEKLSQVIQILQKFQHRLKIRAEEIQYALNKMKSQLSIKQVILLYTSQYCQFYLIINLFLRALICPTEVFYVQPFVKDLFVAIKILNRQIEGRQFVVFRGGLTHIKQITSLYESVGETIQNLGFLSTSRNPQVAHTFFQNILIQIQIPKDLRENSRYNYGYASLDEYSAHPNEDEIIFNPLNYFNIKQVKIHKPVDQRGQQLSQIFYVKLKFGDVCNCFSVPEEDLNESMKITKTLISLHQESHLRFQNQGEVFSQQQAIERKYLGLNYWQKYASIFQSKFPEKIQYSISYLLSSKDSLGLRIKAKQKDKFTKYFFAMNFIGIMLHSLQKYQEAYQIFQKYIQYQKRIIGEKHNNYLTSLIGLASTLSMLGRHEEAIDLDCKCLGIMNNDALKIHPIYLTVLGNLAINIKFTKNFNRALQIQNRCLETKAKIYGKYHSEYLKTLFQIGQINFKLYRYHQAFKVVQQCQQMQKHVLGENHLSYIYSLILMTYILRALSRLQESIAMANKYKTKISQNLSKYHPLRLVLYEIQAITYLQMGNYAKSLNVIISLEKISKNQKYWEIMSKILHSIGLFASSLFYFKKYAIGCSSIMKDRQIYKRAFQNQQKSIKQNIECQKKKVKKRRNFQDFF